ncbi:MAG: hypothetical protein PHW04_00345 [Candidatus Wallbacteria bacterium]|nr:hypothetical protein [Candidatus Wallbacteria bacterium]
MRRQLTIFLILVIFSLAYLEISYEKYRHDVRGIDSWIFGKESENLRHTYACLANLRVIETAMEIYRMGNPQWKSSGIKMDELYKQNQDNRLPVCPDGGVYEVNKTQNEDYISCCSFHNTIDEYFPHGRIGYWRYLFGFE